MQNAYQIMWSEEFLLSLCIIRLNWSDLSQVMKNEIKLNSMKTRSVIMNKTLSDLFLIVEVSACKKFILFSLNIILMRNIIK